MEGGGQPHQLNRHLMVTHHGIDIGFLNQLTTTATATSNYLVTLGAFPAPSISFSTTTRLRATAPANGSSRDSTQENLPPHTPSDGSIAPIPTCISSTPTVARRGIGETPDGCHSVSCYRIFYCTRTQ